MRHPVLGRYIWQYMENGAISTRNKVSALIFLWAAILVAIYFVSALWLKALLLVIAIGVTVHISRLKSTTPQMEESYAAFMDADNR